MSLLLFAIVNNICIQQANISVIVENRLHCLGKSRFALDIIDRDSKFLLTNRMFSKNITPCFIHLYQNLFYGILHGLVRSYFKLHYLGGV